MQASHDADKEIQIRRSSRLIGNPPHYVCAS